MAEAVVLGGLELDRVTGIVIQEHRKLAVHPWPGESGDVVQDLGMGAARIRLTGIAVGEDAAGRLEQLRRAMQSGEPHDFAASAAVASDIEQVIITSLTVHQPPGRLHFYEYQMELIRYVPPPPPLSDFDLGSLADIAAGIEQSAMAAIGEAAASLGTLDGALSAIDEGLEAARSVVEMAENAAELTEGLGKLEEILRAAGDVISAYTG